MFVRPGTGSLNTSIAIAIGPCHAYKVIYEGANNKIVVQ